jgi:ferric-dicitrate binding protein FerR (iron transport regulator)
MSIELVHCYLDGEITPAQFAKLEAWMRQDPENLRAFVLETHAHRQLQNLAHARKAQTEFGVISKPTASGITQLKLDEAPSPSDRSFGQKVRRAKKSCRATGGFPWLAMASAAAVLLLVAGLVFLNQRETTPDKAPGEVVQTNGNVKIRRGQAVLSATAGMALQNGDEISTADTGSMSFQFSGEATSVEVAANTTLVIDVTNGKLIDIKLGGITAVAAKQPSDKPLIVKTPRASSTVLGTTFAVATDADLCRLTVAKGKVRMRRNDGATIDVDGGYYAIAAADLTLKAYPITIATQSSGANAVLSFTLINAETGQPIGGFDPLIDGTVLNLAKLPTRMLNIRANTTADVGHVQFGYDDEHNYHIEGISPFSLARDQQQIGKGYFKWTPAKGSHRLIATPYTANVGIGLKKPVGTPGTSHAINFHVIDR